MKVQGILKDAKIIKIALIIFGLGFFLGVIGANVFKDAYFNDMENFLDGYFDKLYVLDIDQKRLFGYVFWNNFKKYFLFWIFAMTALGIPYMGISVGYTGLSAGFLLAVSMVKFGIKGFFLYILYIFPQCFIYFPVAVITLLQGFNMCMNLYYSGPLNRKGKSKVIFEKVPMILFIFLIILIGALIEAYMNSFILQKMARFF